MGLWDKEHGKGGGEKNPRWREEFAEAKNNRFDDKKKGNSLRLHTDDPLREVR